jgi:hypothetical protein
MPSGLWDPVQNNPFFCYGYGIQHAVTIYNASDTSLRFQDINGELPAAPAQHQLIARHPHFHPPACIHPGQPGMRTHAGTLLQALALDRAFIGRYAMTMQLDILANYDREWESDR